MPLNIICLKEFIHPSTLPFSSKLPAMVDGNDENMWAKNAAPRLLTAFIVRLNGLDSGTPSPKIT